MRWCAHVGAILVMSCGCLRAPSPAEQAAARRVAAEALEALDAGRRDEARGLWLQALKHDRSLAAAHNGLGLLAYEDGRLDEAVACFRRACRRQPPAAYLNNLAAAYAADGQTPRAFHTYDRAIAADPTDPAAYVNLAVLYRQIGNRDAALRGARLAAERFPDRPTVQLTLANALVLAGRAAEAAPIYRRLADVPETAAAAQRGLARAAQATGQTEAALAALERAVEGEPQRADLRFELAACLVNARRFADAERQARHGLEAEPGSAVGRTALAAARLGQNDARGAAAILGPLVEKHPKHLDARALLGDAYVGLGRLDRAVELHRRTVELDLDSPHSRRLLADALMLTGDYVGAARAYRRAIALGDRSADTRTRLIDAIGRGGEVTRALAELAEAAGRHPDDPDIVLRLASFCATRRDEEGARKAFARALELAPKSPQAHLACGHWHRSQKRFLRAADCYRQAIALDERNASAHFALGDVLERLGRTEEAAIRLGRSLELDPSRIEAWLALTRINLDRGALDAARSALDNARPLAQSSAHKDAITDLDQRLAEARKRRRP